MKPKILLVDDKIENLLVLEQTLEDLGVEFVRALSGNEALSATLEYDFALALIDVQMPDMDGYETLKHLRSTKKTEYLPVIFISAIYSDEFYHVKGVETGAIDFLSKPINIQILRGKVSIFLQLYNQRRELEEALANVKTLEGLLPICSYCKSIRDKEGSWSSIEEYLDQNSDMKLSHSICPECAKKHFPNYTKTTS